MDDLKLWMAKENYIDRDVRVVFRLERPRMVLFEGFLSNAECEELITSSRRQMSSSQVIDIDTGGAMAAGADVTEPWSAWEFFRRLLWRRDETLPIPWHGPEVEKKAKAPAKKSS